MHKIRRSLLWISLLAAFTAGANNINLTNITSGTNATGVYLQFDLSWENSWRNTTNYDAAWVFFKMKDVNGAWIPLSLNNTNNTAPVGYGVTVSSDNFGAFVFRSVDGSGNNTLTGVRLGISPQPGSFDVKGFALEMVYIPAGSFYLGDNNFSSNAFRDGNTSAPYNMTTGTATTVVMGTGAGNLNDAFSNGSLSAGFPTGYNDFYMMKYELSFGGYRDFLNTLTYDQQASRTPVAPNSVIGTSVFSTGVFRIRLNIATSGVSNTTPAVYGLDANANGTFNEAVDGEWVSMAGLSYSDCAAFLDWAGLRPLTELEYEKAARGAGILPVTGEFAWGDSLIATLPYTVINSGQTNEGLTSSNSITLGNAIYDQVASSGSYRNGIFASSVSTRKSAGAGYYGAMELTGNVFELVVFTGNVAGRSYTGNNGDGVLTTAGDADEDFWPGINGNNTATAANTIYAGTTGATGSAGMTGRGGAFGGSKSYARLSARYGQVPSNRSGFYGIRGGR